MAVRMPEMNGLDAAPAEELIGTVRVAAEGHALLAPTVTR